MEAVKHTHGHVQEAVKARLSENGATVEVPGQDENDDPDLRVTDSGTVFSTEPVRIEIETSTVTKPGHIINRVYTAADAGEQLVFVLSSDRSVDADPAQRIDTILGDPEFAHGYQDGTTVGLYNGRGHLKTTDGAHVLLPRNGETRGEWTLQQDNGHLRYQQHGAEGQTLVTPLPPEEDSQNENSGITTWGESKGAIQIDKSCIDSWVEYNRSAGEYVVEGEDSRVFEDKRAVQDEYQYIPEPIIPRTDDAVSEVLDQLEYLILEDSEIYRRPYPRRRKVP
jgi:hypothetical protein